MTINIPQGTEFTSNNIIYNFYSLSENLSRSTADIQKSPHQLILDFY